MITEDYCSFEVAKLLKEKGFKILTDKVYDNQGKLDYQNVVCCQEKRLPYISAPTLQMAMKWLRKVHHIEINIAFGFPFIDGKQQYKYFWSIVRVCDNHLKYPMDDQSSACYNEEMADSYEEAVEAALKYSVENLI